MRLQNIPSVVLHPQGGIATERVLKTAIGLLYEWYGDVLGSYMATEEKLNILIRIDECVDDLETLQSCIHHGD